MKKIISVFLIMMLLFSMAVPVFAEEELTETAVEAELPEESAGETMPEEEPAPVTQEEEPEEYPEEEPAPAEEPEEPEAAEEAEDPEPAAEEPDFTEVQQIPEETAEPEAAPQQPADPQDDVLEDGYVLTYELRQNGTYGVSVTSITGTDVEIVIPKKYEGKNVTMFTPTNVFITNRDNIKSMSFPSTIREIPFNLYYFGSSYDQGTSLSNFGTVPHAYPPSAFGYSMQDYLEYIPAFVSENYVGGAYYAGKCLVRVDPEYSGNFTVKSGTICILAGAFAGCSNIKKVTLPDSVEFIGMGAFAWSGVTEVNIPAAVKTPENGDEIPAWTFYRCHRLKTVTISGTVDSLGYCAFYDCTALQSFDFTKVGTIGDFCFFHAFDPAANVVADLSNTKFRNNGFSIGNFAYSGLYGVKFGEGSTSRIPYICFIYCTNLKTVKSSASFPFDIETATFEGCSAITKFTVKPRDILSWAFYGAFSKTGTASVDLSQHNFCGGTELFAESGIYSVKYGDTCRYIGYKQFLNCTNLTSVTLTKSQKIIMVSAFEGCSSLKQDVLAGSGVTDVYLNAFSGTAIEELTIPETMFVMPGGALNNMPSLKTINWKCKDYNPGVPLHSTLNVSGSCFYIGTDTDAYFNNSTASIVTAPTVLNIYSYPADTDMFLMLPTVETINIFDPTYKVVDDRAFIGTLSLKHFNLADGVTLESVGRHAFAWSGLEEVAITKGTKYAPYAFQSCGKLKKIVVEEGVTTIEPFMFCDSGHIETVALPESLKTIRWAAFKNALSGSLIYVPASVEMIEDDAFATTMTSPAANSTGAGDPGRSDDGMVNLYLAGDPAIETEHGEEPELNLLVGIGLEDVLPIPASLVTKVYADESGTNLQAYQAFLSAEGFDQLNVLQKPLLGDGGTVTVENAPEKATAGQEIPKAGMTVKLNGTAVDESSFTIGFDLEDKKIGDREVPVFVTVDAPFYKQADVSAKNVSSSAVKGKLIDITDQAEGSFSVFVQFTDVNDESLAYYKPVYWAVRNGIVSGMSDPATGKPSGLFAPDGSCTRAQFVMMLWKMYGSPKVSGVKNPFTDITPGTKTEKAVLWAYKNGVIKGTSATTFSPNDNITRAQMIMMFWKMAGKPMVSAKESPFSDIPCDSVPEGGQTYKALLWAASIKLTTASEFRPLANCSRAELTLFLYRYNKKIAHAVPV